MKTYYTILFTLVFLSLLTIVAQAGTVKGYYKSNGTYVQSYERSAPDNTRSNNYGSGSGAYYTRDSDKDGTANYLDSDDDNDGVSDDNEPKYGKRR